MSVEGGLGGKGLDSRPYDLTNPAEMRRLVFELLGYMHISVKHGTDTEGRQFALDALKQLHKSRATLEASHPPGQTPSQGDGLGRYSHHPDAANDFCVEVEALGAIAKAARNDAEVFKTYTTTGTEAGNSWNDNHCRAAAALTNLARAAEAALNGEEPQS